VTIGDPIHVAIFCGLLATFLGSPLRTGRARLVAAGAGAIAAGALFIFLTGSSQLAPLAAGLGGILAFAGPALGGRAGTSQPSPGRFEDSSAGLPRAGARGRW
jgi:ABC-type Fe3+-siderophore transport system permease subunit